MFGQAIAKPAHVPDDLVRDYPIKMGTTTPENPFDRMIPAIHADFPPVFYAMDAYPGGSPAWIVRRAADLQAIYADTANFSSKDFAPFAKLVGGNWSSLPAETDPPMHGLYRKWINPLFTPKAMAALEGKIDDYARDYCERLRPRGGCEFMGDFAFEFPIKVFLELMGFPIELAPTFLEWEMGLLHTNDLGEIAAATRNVVDYLQGEINRRKADPGEDFLSYGIRTEIDGRQLTNDELIGFAFNLFIGGLDTVSTNMAWQFRHLAEHPGHQAQLRANPAMIPNAIEEMMRAYAAVTTFRTVINPVSIGGVAFQPGDKVAMPTCLAGRDPEQYERPNEVILDRKTRYLSFGFGPHLCVGMHLARREMRLAIERFLEIIPPFRVAEGEPVHSYLGGIIQPVTLPMVWDA